MGIERLCCNVCGWILPEEAIDEVVNETWETYCIKCKKIRFFNKVKKMGIERLEIHQPDYKAKSYREYSIVELGNIISFFVKRASHRTNPDKLRKDLYDAKNYLAMLEERVKNKAEKLEIDYESL